MYITPMNGAFMIGLDNGEQVSLSSRNFGRLYGLMAKHMGLGTPPSDALACLKLCADTLNTIGARGGEVTDETLMNAGNDVRLATSVLKKYEEKR